MCSFLIIFSVPSSDVKTLQDDSFDQAGEGVPVLMSNVQCTSREWSLTSCRYEEQSSCGHNHTDDAGVTCSKGE